MGKKSSGSSTKQVPTLTGGQRSLLDDLTQLLGTQLGGGVSPYQGQRVAPMAPLQQQGLDVISNMMGQAGGAQDILNEAISSFAPRPQYQEQAGGALSQMLAPYDPAGAQEYWRSSMVTPAIETWQRDIMPAIDEHYAARNAADSGPMNRALARSGEQLGTNLSSQLASLLFQGEQAHKGRQLQAMPEAYRATMAPVDLLNSIMSGVGSMPMQLAQAGLSGGQLQRGITGEQLGAEQQMWGESQGYANPWLQLLGPALGTPAFQTVQEQKGPGLTSLLAPIAGAGLGAMMPDVLRRLFGGGSGGGAMVGTPGGLGGAYSPSSLIWG